jgi:hypothetical protein
MIRALHALIFSGFAIYMKPASNSIVKGVHVSQILHLGNKTEGNHAGLLAYVSHHIYLLINTAIIMQIKDRITSSCRCLIRY